MVVFIGGNDVRGIYGTVYDGGGAGTFNVAVTIGSNGDAPNYDLYTSVNGGAFTFNSNRVPRQLPVTTAAGAVQQAVPLEVTAVSCWLQRAFTVWRTCTTTLVPKA